MVVNVSLSSSRCGGKSGAERTNKKCKWNSQMTFCFVDHHAEFYFYTTGSFK
jgi:hypothetical protein